MYHEGSLIIMFLKLLNLDTIHEQPPSGMPYGHTFNDASGKNLTTHIGKNNLHIVMKNHCMIISLTDMNKSFKAFRLLPEGCFPAQLCAKVLIMLTAEISIKLQGMKGSTCKAEN
jgi:hypothetical protein